MSCTTRTMVTAVEECPGLFALRVDSGDVQTYTLLTETQLQSLLASARDAIASARTRKRH